MAGLNLQSHRADMVDELCQLGHEASVQYNDVISRMPRHLADMAGAPRQRPSNVTTW